MSESMLRQIAELQMLSTEQLWERWRALLGTEPPHYQREFLIRRLAYRIQEIVHGGLSNTSRQLIAEIVGEQNSTRSTHTRQSTRTPSRPLPGTRLIREWNGQRYEVTVTAAGFEFAGKPYHSLSAIATAITGTHWNGRRFFGLPSSKERSQ